VGSPLGPGEQGRVDAVETCFISSSKEVQNSTVCQETHGDHFFGDSKGLLLIDYLPPKTTMNGQYYASLLLKLRDAIQEKRRGMLMRGVWLLHDNAPIHKSMIAQQAVRDCGFVQLDHPAYCPDLAPSDYFLFCNLKSHLRGVRYPDDEALKEAVKE